MAVAAPVGSPAPAPVRRPGQAPAQAAAARGATVAGGLVAVLAVLGACSALTQALKARTLLVGGQGVAAGRRRRPGRPRHARGPGRGPGPGRRRPAQHRRAPATGSPARRCWPWPPSSPGCGASGPGSSGSIDDSAAAATAGRDLLAAVDGLAERTQVRDGALPLDGLAELQQQVPPGRRGHRAAGPTAAAASGARWATPGAEFDDVAASSARRLTEGADALGAARTFVGAARRPPLPRRRPEQRRDARPGRRPVLCRRHASGAGGWSWSSRGRSPTCTLDAPPAPTPSLPAPRRCSGRSGPTQTWQSVNATADFAFSGRAMADMYRQATGQPVDGVIALDVPALAGCCARSARCRSTVWPSRSPPTTSAACC